MEQATKPSFESVKVVEVDCLHLQEVEALQEVLEVEVEEPQDLRHGGGHMDHSGKSMNFNKSSSRGPLPVKRGPLPRSRGPLPKRSIPSGPKAIQAEITQVLLIQQYVTPPQDYTYRDYPSRGYRDTDGYGHDHDYSDHPSGGS
ncbi:hypothetical protein P7K49_027024 [Saguinus oedipus]|uniref:Uncharacterized protein n=1 Tax=Saguinus oedipus TaxID=9490 RepID=A0ABQ9UEU4_SAGOE|nr:hypothetical protein P7K49_027024 [Saguinus oedipus]